MPTVPEYQAFKEASPDVQKNMTFYYNASASLRTWSAVSDEGSAALSGVFGEIFEEGQSKGLIFPKNVPLYPDIWSNNFGFCHLNGNILFFSVGLSPQLTLCCHVYSTKCPLPKSN